MAFDPSLLDDHLDASLQDFEPSNLPAFGYPSAHSGFQSTRSDSEEADSRGANSPRMDDSADDGYDPPAWRRLQNGDRSSGFWRKAQDDALSDNKHNDRDGGDDDDTYPHGATALGIRGLGRGLGLNVRDRGLTVSRESSPEYESADDGEAILYRASRTRLPTGSLSPEKERSPEPEYHLARTHVKLEEDMDEAMKATLASPKEVSENYIRFAIRAEVQQRTEPIDTAINFLRSRTKSWGSLFFSLLTVVVSVSAVRTLFRPAAPRPVPDLIKVAGIARGFEPLIYYSENGVQQVGDLQATGVAVWDLGESVRISNMTSAPIIVKELDDLSDSLKTLAIELTKFSANVDSDIDGILIVMDWARRELSQLQHLPTQPLTTAFDNVHNLLSTAGILEDVATGQPTRLGRLTASLFGPSTPQRTRATLQRTFTEFLSVLEEAIAGELQHSLALFALFEAIDRQFLTLARTVTREASVQDERHADLLASMWTRILGASAATVHKYERNRRLLQNVREKTVHNKGVLLEHNQRLLALKANLEALRRRLVSPLVRGAVVSAGSGGGGSTSTLTVEEQVRGLEDVAGYLEGVRARQKGKLLEMRYGRVPELDRD